jgi:hypothetical protein
MKRTLLASAFVLMPLCSQAASAPAAAPLAPYRKHAEAPVQDWRAANDTVAQRGGWRAYSREAHEALKREREARSAPGVRR